MQFKPKAMEFPTETIRYSPSGRQRIEIRFIPQTITVQRNGHAPNCSMKIASHSHGHVSAVYTMPGKFMGILQSEIAKSEVHGGDRIMRNGNVTEQKNELQIKRANSSLRLTPEMSRSTELIGHEVCLRQLGFVPVFIFHASVQRRTAGRRARPSGLDARSIGAISVQISKICGFFGRQQAKRLFLPRWRCASYRMVHAEKSGFNPVV